MPTIQIADKPTLDTVYRKVKNLKQANNINNDKLEEFQAENTHNVKYLTTLPYNFWDGAAVVYNNEIHILGGGEKYTYHYKFNEITTVWEEVSTLPFNFNGRAIVYNNEIHIFGYSKTGHYVFDGSSWKQASTLPYDPFSFSVVVFNNEIHIFGLYVNSKSNTHYKWDGNSWTKVSTIPFNCYYCKTVVYDNEIYILNGDKKFAKWDGNSWTTLNDLPYSFYNGSAILYDNKIHILGGAESDGVKKTSYNFHYCYNKENDSWDKTISLPYCISFHSVVTHGNCLFVLGGYTNMTSSAVFDGSSWKTDSTVNYSYITYTSYLAKSIKLLEGQKLLCDSSSLSVKYQGDDHNIDTPYTASTDRTVYLVPQNGDKSKLVYSII